MRLGVRHRGTAAHVCCGSCLQWQLQQHTCAATAIPLREAGWAARGQATESPASPPPPPAWHPTRRATRAASSRSSLPTASPTAPSTLMLRWRCTTSGVGRAGLGWRLVDVNVACGAPCRFGRSRSGCVHGCRKWLWLSGQGPRPITPHLPASPLSRRQPHRLPACGRRHAALHLLCERLRPCSPYWELPDPRWAGAAGARGHAQPRPLPSGAC